MKINLEEDLLINFREISVVKDLPSSGRLTKVLNHNNTAPPLEADLAIGPVAQAAPVAKLDPVVVSTEVIDVVVAHKGGPDITGLQKGREEPRVDVAVVHALLLAAHLVDGKLVLGNGDVEEGQGRAGGGVAVVQALGGVQVPV